jgi:hypothetical protein
MSAVENSPPLPDEEIETPESQVQEIHAAVIREFNDPHEGFEPIPLWLALVFAALLFWGGMYLASNSGDYRMDVFDRLDPKPPSETISPRPQPATTAPPKIPPDHVDPGTPKSEKK